MFIELVDSLRCVEPHEATWLVASVTRMDGRHIVDGTLGCPTCRREYPITGGVGVFDDAPASRERTAERGAAREADPGRVLRAAALLGLSEGGGLVLLGGDWAACAPALAVLAPSHYVTVNAAAGLPEIEALSHLRVGSSLPFAAGSVRAVALDAGTATPALVASAAAVLRGSGRLVAPASVPVPNGITVLARDAEDWVGERASPPSLPITLRRA